MGWEGMGGISKERIGAISDGVIAVAATLLVIELEVPEGTMMTSELVFHWSRTFAAWVISFIMIVMVWLDNHMFLSKAKQWSLGLALLTFMQLAAVSLVPFASNLVIDHYESKAAMLAFNGVLLLNGLVSFAMSQLLGANPSAMLSPTGAAHLRTRGLIQLALYLSVTAVAVTAGHLRHPLFGVLLWAISPILLLLVGFHRSSKSLHANSDE